MADNPSNWVEARRQRQQLGAEADKEFLSSYRGTIVDNKDPEQLGRVKVRVPQIAGDNVIAEWAWPKGPIAGEDFGDFMIPPVGSPVWVEFEQGDPRYPIWTGGHWAKEGGKVPSEGKQNDPRNRVRKSEKFVIEMDDANGVVRVKDKAGGQFYEMTEGGNFKIKTSAKADIETVSFNVQASGTGQLVLGGATIAYGAGGLTITVGPAVLSIGAGGIEVMGKDFLNHMHDGVDPGGGISGGVV